MLSHSGDDSIVDHLETARKWMKNIADFLTNKTTIGDQTITFLKWNHNHLETKANSAFHPSRVGK